MGHLAVDIISRQIEEERVNINDLKIKIADCVIKAHSTEPKEIHLIFDNLNQLSKLIAQVKPKEDMLNQLFKAQLKLEEEIDTAKRHGAEIED